MNIKSRKLRVWLISVGAIVVIYLFYNLISRTPPIELDTGGAIAESNTVESDGNVGKVNGVGVGTIQKAKYTHLNVRKQVDREFGFEKLLHVEGNEWEIEKPYMNIYRYNLKCYMTADKGMVQIEDAVGKPTPKDATLTGNVVMHIVPTKDSNVEEGFVYLDDVIFISERSQFSTAGPVKFTSHDAELLGKGLELVYNDELDHLEYLKILELKTLRIKQSSKASLLSSEAPASPRASPASTTSPPKMSEGKQSEQAAESIAAKDQQKAKEMPTASSGAIEKKKGTYYKCVLRKNVIIDGPGQLVLADNVSIDDILWSKGPEKKYENKDTGGTEKAETPVEAVKAPEEKTSGKTEIAEENVASPRSEPNKFTEEITDIVVTCENGIAVVPMDSSIIPQSAATNDKGLKSFNDEKGRPTFVAQKIDYSTITRNTIANGLSELTFYANDVMGTEGKPNSSEKGQGKQPRVPVKVTAQEKAEFLSASNQAVFEGNVLCTMLKDNVSFQQKYSLSAPKLTIDLSKGRETSATGEKQPSTDIKHLTANGKVVQLDTSKWAGEELLGFTKLKCLQFDYDANQQMFSATGSGIIAADNSKIAEPKKGTGKFSLQRPCYAVMRNFETLKYFKETNLIIADAGAEQILIDYFPVIKGKQEQQTSTTSNHIEVVLYETSSGQTELSTLSAKGGITYEEEIAKKGKTIQFVGSEMFYDNDKGMITAWGDESQPCFLNGALAPGIEYNLKTDRIKTKIISPGMLQMGR
jgi:hypothetical protein